jgi:hypothetical protein
MAGYSQQQMLNQNTQDFPNNNSGQITPADLRDFNSNLINSVQFTDTPTPNATSASYAATASYASVAQTLLGTVVSASYALTASFALNSSTINTGSFATTASLMAYATTASFQAYTASMNTATSSYATKAEVNAYTGSTNAFTASMKTYTGSVNTQLTSLQAFTSSLNTWTGSATSQFAGTASYATTARNVVNGLNISASNITVAQNETINGNLYVYGTASFAYTKTTTGSAVYIGDSFIVLNADAPTQPFAGIKVYDTGSGPNVTASLEWNGNNDYWITVEETGKSAGILTGVSGSKGSEVFPSLNTLTKGSGNNEIRNSNITDNGSVVAINSNTQITGSLGITSDINMVNGTNLVTHHVKAPSTNGVEIQTNSGGVVGLFGAGGSLGTTFYGQVNATAFSGSGALVYGVVSSSYASNAQTSFSSISASYANNAGNAATANSATSASYASNAQTAFSVTSASFATTASYALNAGAGGVQGSEIYSYTFLLMGA